MAAFSGKGRRDQAIMGIGRGEKGAGNDEG